MKKNYTAPVVEIEYVDAQSNVLLITSPIEIGDPVGDDEEITADVKGTNLWDNEW